MKKGLIQIYTGDGKGKTTAAFGQALRAAGRKMKVIIIQFFKNQPSGEVLALTDYFPGIEIFRFNSQAKFIRNMKPGEKELLKQETLEGIKTVKQIFSTHSCDLLVLDEITYPLQYKFITIAEMKTILNLKPVDLELVLTGRNVPAELVDLADLVTEMKKLKHPFDKNIPVRRGIEF